MKKKKVVLAGDPTNTNEDYIFASVSEKGVVIHQWDAVMKK